MPCVSCILSSKLQLKTFNSIQNKQTNKKSKTQKSLCPSPLPPSFPLSNTFLPPISPSLLS